MTDKVTQIPISKLHAFEDNPFKVTDNEEMTSLIESIKERGIIVPLVVRTNKNGEYEIISGHRRMYAAEKAGLETVPAFVRDMDRHAAAITLVDSNLHREHILPSEKAFAYKLKMEALKHQGTSCQIGTKLRSDEVIAENTDDSTRQIHRYIRLTSLTPEILKMVDDGKIAFTPAVELSYLSEEEQYILLDAMDSEDRTPSYSQAVRMKKLSQEGRLDEETIVGIMCEVKPNQVEKIKLPADRVRGYFPGSYTDRQVEETIFRILDDWHRQQQRRKHDAR